MFSLILIFGIAPGAFAANGNDKNTPPANGHNNNGIAASSKDNNSVHQTSAIKHTGKITKFVSPQIQTLANQIFNGGDPDFLDGNEMTQWTQANDFTFSQTTDVTDVHVSTIESGVWDGTATWFIYSDNGGKPGSLVATGSAANLVKNNLGAWPGSPGFTMFSYDFNLDNPVTLPPGTYWLALHFAKDWSTLDGIYWATGPTVGQIGKEDFDNQLSWATTLNSNEEQVDHAFKLTGNSVRADPTSSPVGGMGIPIDTTALLLAGVQGSAFWMIPAIIVAGAGIGILSFRRSKKKQN